MKRPKLWATDHRAAVLESVATSPQRPTHAQIIRDCTGPDFDKPTIVTMTCQLAKEGLIGRNEDKTFFITTAGFAWLTEGRFDRTLPAYSERPRSRKHKKETEL